VKTTARERLLPVDERPGAGSRAGADLEAEGLLDGVQGSTRTAGERLLRELLADGSTLEELRDAVAKDRIALLPSERLLQSGDRHVPRYTAEEVAEQAGVGVEDLRSTNAALGLPLAAPGVPVHTEVDVELASQLAVALAAGLSVEAVAEVDRIIARSITQMVAASRTVVIEATLRPGMTEHEAAQAWAMAASQLVPSVTRRIMLAFEAHLLKAIEHEYIGLAEIGAGKAAGARAVSVAFADLVGFTQLGELLSPEDLARIARRLEETATSVVTPSPIVAKTIGDAIMLVSPEPGDLLRTIIALIEHAATLEGFPPIRAGVAHGDVHERSGEWFGEIVNLASRITRAAPAGLVVATDVVREQIPDGFLWTPFVAGELKGVQRRPRLYAVTRASDPKPPDQATIRTGRSTAERPLTREANRLGRGVS
jgi:adenylate cyclase